MATLFHQPYVQEILSIFKINEIFEVLISNHAQWNCLYLQKDFLKHFPARETWGVW